MAKQKYIYLLKHNGQVMSAVPSLYTGEKQFGALIEHTDWNEQTHTKEVYSHKQYGKCIGMSAEFENGTKIALERVPIFGSKEAFIKTLGLSTTYDNDNK